jgi:uncharacterized membrane protein YoaK (UPF0700 family)
MDPNVLATNVMALTWPAIMAILMPIFMKSLEGKEFVTSNTWLAMGVTWVLSAMIYILTVLIFKFWTNPIFSFWPILAQSLIYGVVFYSFFNFLKREAKKRETE